ncbi:MAG: hypothetical protein K8I27_12345 [Planctomycetes bacterium]|nr:hypothetical protein [Planctomycetota bacterium]
MIRRVLAITGAALMEALRARLSPLIALVLVAAVPMTALVLGEDADTRAWLVRSVTAEGLRVLLPLGAILGGGFLLKPNLKRGWTILPARRAEYFTGGALAGALVLMLSSALFAGGGLIGNLAFGSDLTVTSQGVEINKQRERDGVTVYAEGKGEGYTWANPNYNEELLAELPAQPGNDLSGTIEFRMVWTAEGAPRDRAPVAVALIDADGRHELESRVLSRYRLHFHGRVNGPAQLVITPTDPVLIIGTTPDRIRVEVDRTGATGSILRLWVLCVAAALLCLSAVLLVRALATAPTAVLAGLLLLSVLTMLPNLGPTSGMARDRRAAVEGVRPDITLAQRLEDELAAIPRLHPETAFDEYLGARVVPGNAWGDAGLRLLAALAMLPIGALLFRARQIAR